jgi:hypothetical protein
VKQHAGRLYPPPGGGELRKVFKTCPLSSR